MQVDLFAIQSGHCFVANKVYPNLHIPLCVAATYKTFMQRTNLLNPSLFQNLFITRLAFYRLTKKAIYFSNIGLGKILVNAYNRCEF